MSPNANVGPPAILFFGADGRELRQYRVVGFMNAEKFRALVEKAVASPLQST